MPIEEFIYKGVKISIEEDTKHKLMLDDEEIPIFYDITVNRYSTKYLPFFTYDSLSDLAKAIIDQRKSS